jgi:hypothetical protein
VIINPALQKILKGILQTEEEDKGNQENMGKVNFPSSVKSKWRLGKNQTLSKQETDKYYYISFNNNSKCQ